ADHCHWSGFDARAGARQSGRHRGTKRRSPTCDRRVPADVSARSHARRFGAAPDRALDAGRARSRSARAGKSLSSTERPQIMRCSHETIERRRTRTVQVLIALGTIVLLEGVARGALLALPAQPSSVRFAFSDVWAHARNPFHELDRDLFWRLRRGY